MVQESEVNVSIERPGGGSAKFCLSSGAGRDLVKRIKDLGLSPGALARPFYFTGKNLTRKVIKVVRIPRVRIPASKLKWSAVRPRRRGARPFPNATPKKRMKAVAMERSERGANIEMAASPAGKKTLEMVP